jgi:hypothetical protein
VADAFRLIGAMDAIKRVHLALPQIQRPGAKRIIGSAVHADTALQLHHVLPNFRLALQNVRGRIPVRPFLLIMNGRDARPPIAFLAGPDFVLQRLPSILDGIQKMIPGSTMMVPGFCPL